MMSEIEKLITEYKGLGIDRQLDYDRFCLYSIITHSTAIEGSTVSEIENQLLFDEGLSSGKPMVEQFMNLDLKHAYERAGEISGSHELITPELLCELSSLVMKNTGSDYNTIAGSFSSSNGDLRLLNVSAGRGGKSYMAWQKVPGKLEELCTWLNESRDKMTLMGIDELYRLSFEAHYRLVGIHPWADGNGRMARLIMNLLQWEAGIVPSIVKKEKRAEYIKSLADAQEQGDMTSFVDFMIRHHEDNIRQQIIEYIEATEGTTAKDAIETKDAEATKETEENDTISTRYDTLNDTLNLTVKEKNILEEMLKNPSITINQIVGGTGFSRPTVTRAIKSLKEKSYIERDGSKKTGKWKIKY